jgi:hypothetical protein
VIGRICQIELRVFLLRRFKAKGTDLPDGIAKSWVRPRRHTEETSDPRSELTFSETRLWVAWSIVGLLAGQGLDRVVTNPCPKEDDIWLSQLVRCRAWETAPTLILPWTTLGKPRSSLGGAPVRMPLPMAGLPLPGLRLQGNRGARGTDLRADGHSNGSVAVKTPRTGVGQSDNNVRRPVRWRPDLGNRCTKIGAGRKVAHVCRERGAVGTREDLYVLCTSSGINRILSK